MAFDKLLDFGFNHIDIWRSEPMSLAQLMIPAESAHDTIAALGEVGLLQFKDLNADKSAFQRSYANQVKRCDEMARRLRFFKEQVAKSGASITTPTPMDKSAQFDEIETHLEEQEKELLELNDNTDKLLRTHAELTEMQLVLEKAGRFFDQKAKFGEVTMESYDRSFAALGIDTDAPLLEGGAVDKVAKVGFIAGTIMQEKMNGFERLLFRATRGNMFLRSTPVDLVRDPATGEMQKKSVFAVFFAGERSRQKAIKICDAFNANRYPFPDDSTRQKQMHAEVTSRLRELQTTNEAGERRRDALIHSIARGLDGWTSLVRREKAIYHIMNKLSIDVTSKVLIAEVWLPDSAYDQIQAVLNTAAESSNTQLRSIVQPLVTGEEPPTHYITNKFTSCFQTIVEAYGVARYREVNPAVLTIMTFPFLFAVMFGDWGHAMLMLGFAGLLLYKEKDLMGKDLGDMLGMLFDGRYCILLMGIYSIYTGFIYNEWFSMPTFIMGSSRFQCWNATNQVMMYPPTPPAGWPNSTLYNMPVGSPVDLRDCAHFGGKIEWPYRSPYVFGVDPIWHGRKTELPYMNSMKMKMSILIGVTHMNFGILMSVFNNAHFRDTLSTVCEFVPQMIFLNAIFGYLCILILVKWFTGSYADLYNVLIRMFLGMGDVLPANQLFAGQKGLQQLLLVIAFISVPWMLLPKPLILKKRAEALQKQKNAHGTVEMISSQSYGSLDHVDDEESRMPKVHGSTANLQAKAAAGGGGGGHGHGHGDHFEFGEVMVHQMIHTIEFVLGAVSNTASYLRLWALSLAHSQLSAVFYDRVLMMGITINPIASVIAFFVFACATLGVLMVMESLSAFLHALRLHWVEFMNKFYKGDGYKFVPFSFVLIASTAEDEKSS